jgi:hypothetical protein
MLPPKIAEHCRAVRWAAVSAQHKGDDPVATCTVLLLPYTSADKGATPEYMQWVRTAPHVITHIATLSGADPHAESNVLWARETHKATPHTLACDLLLVWNKAARLQLGWSPGKHAALVTALRGAYAGSVKEPAATTHPTHPPPAGGAAGHPAWEATKRFRQAPLESPHAARMQPHAARAHPPPTAQPTRPLEPRHECHNITFTDASRMRVSAPGASPDAPSHMQSGAATWRMQQHGGSPQVTLIDPGHAAGGDTVNHAELAALHEAIRASPSTHRRN